MNGQIAPISDNSCNVNSNLEYLNKPVVINKDNTLTGRLHSIIIYENKLTDEKISEVYNHLARSLLTLDIKDNICNRPNLYKKSITIITPIKDEFKKYTCCPFKEKEICKSIECNGVDWNKPNYKETLPKICKDKVNNYCRNNFEDQYCNLLRKDKVNNKDALEIVQKNINKLEFKKKDCSNCDEKIDLKDYIRKDKVPCWGCNLDEIKNL